MPDLKLPKETISITHPNLEREWDYEKNAPFIPSEITSGSHKVFWWICINGHSWQATVYHRSSGQNCPICSNRQVLVGFNDLATTNPTLAEEWNNEKNGDLTPYDITSGSGMVVWWKCKLGHEWETSVYNRTKGTGCPLCSKKTRITTQIKKKIDKNGALSEINPKLAGEWNTERNRDITPSAVTAFSGKKVWWKCSQGHEWEAIISNRSKGSGCPICARIKVLSDIESFGMKESVLATEWHPVKNIPLSPFDVAANSNKVVWWQCKAGHEWRASVRVRVHGKGCPICKRQLLKINKTIKQRKTKINIVDSFPFLLNEWDYEKNYPIIPEDVSNGSSKKVWWICPAGHSYDMRVCSRTRNKCGCPYCSVPARRILVGFNDFQTKYPDVSKEWHPTKNENHSPSEFLPGSGKKVWWQCSKGHEWIASIADRSEGSMCPLCSSERKTSFPEQVVYFYISQAYKDAVNREKVDSHEIDIYLPSRKIGIEYDGQFYHNSKNSAQREHKKNDDLLSKGIRLIRIKESKEDKVLEDIIFYKYDSSYRHLKWAIEALFKLLDLDINVPEINIDEDRNSILQQYIRLEKENSLALKFPNIAKQWNYDRNGSLNPTLLSFSSNKKVWWKCEKGHEWESSVGKRTAGRGCPICSSNKLCKGINDLHSVNPVLSSQWHPTKNGNLTPSDVFPNSMKKVWWKCEKGHEWEATINNRTRGRNCPYCSGRRLLVGFNDLQSVYPLIAKEWNYPRNDGIQPKDVTKGSNKNVWWICSKGHEWETPVFRRTQGDGCPICGKQKRVISQNKNLIDSHGSLLTTNPELAREWNYSRNIDITPDIVLEGSGKRVWWICQKGHEWKAKICERNNGAGCPFCSGHKHYPIICIETGCIYSTASQAARSCGLKSGRSITLCCKGATKSSGGLHWKYYEHE